MKVKGIRGLSIPEIQEEVTNGASFVQFSYCLSAIIVSFRYSSAVYFIRRNENPFLKGLPFTLLTFVFGWWGIPFGVVYSIGCLVTNLSGGKDRTGDMMKTLYRHTNGHVFEFEKCTAPASMN